MERRVTAARPEFGSGRAVGTPEASGVERGLLTASSTRPSRGLRRAAFTMLEVILVISIIGVLSAIAVPRLATAGTGAEYAAQHRDWQVVQKQIELFAIEHFGVYPAGVGDGSNAAYTSAAFANHIGRFTDVNGNASATRSANHPFGQYLRDGLPAIHYGPHKGRSGVRVITGSTSPQYAAGQVVGWIYNATTGDIIPNVPARSESEKSGLPLVDFGVSVVTELGGGELGALDE